MLPAGGRRRTDRGDFRRLGAPDSQLLVEFAHREYERVKDMLASTGLFADPVPVPDDADPQTKMLAIVGRSADWSPPT